MLARTLHKLTKMIKTRQPLHSTTGTHRAVTVVPENVSCAVYMPLGV
jgi:hypothetical protein